MASADRLIDRTIQDGESLTPISEEPYTMHSRRVLYNLLPNTLAMVG